MKLQITKDDPLGILASTKPVVEQAHFVLIHDDKLEVLAKGVIERFNKGLDSQELGFGSAGNLTDDIQLIFIEDTVNFCFWPDKGQPKWEVEWPDQNTVAGGWYGLVACFKRGLTEKIPILDADYLSELTAEQARQFFRGKNGVDIPLLDERVQNLREAGKILREKFYGRFENMLKSSGYNSVSIVNAVIENFPSFKDVSQFNGQEIRFLKRAQIYPNDLAYALKGTDTSIANLDKLTAYADYKLPQVLRAFGVLEYERSLAERVDDLIEIPHDSAEEIEIRSATIWAIELLRQKIGKLTAGEIDNTIWLMSQTMQNESKPYHRTRTIFY
ncbi:MAG: queuosine salvage family protein [Minisyncoccia bacterium]